MRHKYDNLGQIYTPDIHKARRRGGVTYQTKPMKTINPFLLKKGLLDTKTFGTTSRSLITFSAQISIHDKIQEITPYARKKEIVRHVYRL